MTRTVTMRGGALDALMPMHLELDSEGTILHVGATLSKLRPEGFFLGKSVFELFHFKRPKQAETFEELVEARGIPFQIQFLSAPETQFRAQLALLNPGEGGILNLAFGVSFLSEIGKYCLHAGDFAFTDPTLDMLYLIEANAATRRESDSLTRRLMGARIAAEEQAFTDTLTGLKNRRALDHVLERNRRLDNDFTLVAIDLDSFKAVNDKLGHAAGDHVLQQISKLMVARTTEGDTLCRVGGDEFVIVLGDETDVQAVARRAKQLIRAIEDPIAFKDIECHVSASIGIASTAQFPDWSIEQLMRVADVALYEAKNLGKAQAIIYSETLAANAMEIEPRGNRLEARPDAYPPKAAL